MAIPTVRFAPSPTGAFHLGNFRTAWVADALARRLGGELVLRFEDIDGPRVLPGAEARQREELAELGLSWGRAYRQSERHERHRALFERAAREERIYPCFCSRREVQAAVAGLASAPHAPAPVYHGACRAWGPAERRAAEAARPRDVTMGWRFRDADPSGARDFLVARTAALDGAGFTPAYPWACAIDDYDGGYSVLVRAWDLESAAAQQRALHALVAGWEGPRPVPAVFHTALITDDAGRRLEKRTPGVTWPELKARAGSAAAVAERLAASFAAEWPADPSVLRAWIAPGALGGESRRERRVSELGFAG
jgi:glutamyl/glutaminyl-tRNA synthetase